MEFVDLSRYEFLQSPIPMRSLGWLGQEMGIQGGDEGPMTDADVLLVQAASTRLVSLTLGFHECEFCPETAAFRGNGEYHYYLSDGNIYAAPSMILHYLREHDYRLPYEFREGLRATTALTWDVRAERLCEVLADASQDFDFRCQAITDLSNWCHPMAFEALLHATEDEELVDLVGHEIGRSLATYVACDFAARLKLIALPDVVNFGMGLNS